MALRCVRHTSSYKYAIQPSATFVDRSIPEFQTARSPLTMGLSWRRVQFHLQGFASGIPTESEEIEALYLFLALRSSLLSAGGVRSVDILASEPAVFSELDLEYLFRWPLEGRARTVASTQWLPSLRFQKLAENLRTLEGAFTRVHSLKYRVKDDDWTGTGMVALAAAFSRFLHQGTSLERLCLVSGDKGGQMMVNGNDTEDNDDNEDDDDDEDNDDDYSYNDVYQAWRFNDADAFW
ncbi:hypothetical protein C1H76_8718 [Elsinoe australis]|uniref:Uncharacterized protein n=1 Tax=Elsinoe australis TaxID=40998 RepID=A0A4U7AR95_9PEZI|nr:hypothetical protein C1H76_8718 [Elsinoe australis]